METAKEKIAEIIEQQPDDSSYDEILRELAFARMVDRGIGRFEGWSYYIQ